MPTLDIARLAEGLREQTAAMARAVAGGDPEAMVPTCPEWRLRELVGHIGQADRWGAQLVRKGEPLPVPYPEQADPGAPGEWGRWLHEGAAELVDAVREVGEDTEVWTFLGPAPAGFWLRRMCCETAIHHYDAALTTGAAYEIAEDLAADVITEGLELMSHRRAETFLPELALLRGAGERLAFLPRGMAGWVVTRLPEGVRWERGNGPGDVVVSGTVAEIMLVLSRRAPAGDVAGNRGLLEHWLARTAI